MAGVNGDAKVKSLRGSNEFGLTARLSRLAATCYEASITVYMPLILPVMDRNRGTLVSSLCRDRIDFGVGADGRRAEKARATYP